MPRPSRNNIEEDIADRIIALLDKGELPPWEKNWRNSIHGDPRNAVTTKPYRGVNIWLTTLTQFLQGYEDPRWLTFRQAQTAGGHVKKGEKSTHIVFWKPIEKLNQDNPEETVKFTLLRYYSVFNLEQTEDCRVTPLNELKEQTVNHDPIEAAESVYRDMPNPPRVTTYQVSNHPPCYIPSMDLIRVPEKSRYEQIQKWYNTLFHELTHSTGHPKRLNRLDTERTQDNIHAYGKEELVAGMGAAMLAGHAGLDTQLLEYDASYIAHWKKTIQGDKSIVLRAASLAQKAVDYITAGNAEPQHPAPDRDLTPAAVTP